jgi:hypothetical protein
MFLKLLICVGIVLQAGLLSVLGLGFLWLAEMPYDDIIGCVVALSAMWAALETAPLRFRLRRAAVCCRLRLRL